MRHDFLFSVISPTYYACNPYIIETYRSLAQQTYPYWEWIVGVNNGGIVPDTAKADPRVRVYEIEFRGTSRAKQELAEKSRGHIIVILDADDMLEPTALEEVARAYIENPWAESVITEEHFIACNGIPLEAEAKRLLAVPQMWRGKYIYRRVWKKLDSSYVGWLPTHLLTFKREPFELIGGYNIGIRFGDDYGLMMKAMKFNLRIKFLREPLYICRWYNQGVHHRELDACIELANYLRMAQRSFWLYEDYQEVQDKWLSSRQQ